MSRSDSVTLIAGWQAPVRSAQMRDLSLTGISLITDMKLEGQQVIRILGPYFDVLATVVGCRSDGRRVEVHASLLNAIFSKQKGVSFRSRRRFTDGDRPCWLAPSPAIRKPDEGDENVDLRDRCDLDHGVRGTRITAGQGCDHRRQSCLHPHEAGPGHRSIGIRQTDAGEVEPVPHLDQLMQTRMRSLEQQAERSGHPVQFRADSARARLKYDLDGQPVEEWVTAVSVAGTGDRYGLGDDSASIAVRSCCLRCARRKASWRPTRSCFR